MTPSLLRFTWLLVGPNALMCTVAVLVVGFGAYLAWLGGAAQVDQGLAIALFLQLFGASTGYRGRLRAGHFDPILVQRPGPCRLAAAHWIVSVAPGIAAWIALGLVALIAGASPLPTALTPAGLTLVVYASTISWTIAVAAGRLSGALVWIGALMALAATRQLTALRVGFEAHPETMGDWLRTVRSTLVVPAFLMMDARDVGVAVVAPIAIAAAAAWAIGAAMIRAFDARLERS